MTATILRGTPTLAIPSTQNSAPIIEFRCLYTHDLRRKSKRWQDGYLRFHTFNKRVMVYDVPRNFIGDMHWRESGEIQDGDELELEKGILVQVEETVGRIDQDLTGLFEKKIKGREDRAAQAKSTNSPVRNGMSSPVMPANRQQNGNGRSDPVPTPMSQLLPKTLNTLLGTPRGPQGRAIIPTKSPFQQTHKAAGDSQWDDRRATKRRRLGDGRPIPDARNDQQKRQPGPRRNARNDRPRLMAEAGTQAHQGQYASSSRPTPRSRNVVDVDVEGSSPVRKVHNPATRISRPPQHAGDSLRRLTRPSSPAVSTTSHRPTVPGPPRRASKPVTLPTEDEGEESPAQPLRLVGHAPRKKLLCQTTSTSNGTKARPEESEKPSPKPADELEKFNRAQKARLQARQRRNLQRKERDLINTNHGQPLTQTKAPPTTDPRDRSISLPSTSSLAYQKGTRPVKANVPEKSISITQTPQPLHPKNNLTTTKPPTPTLPPPSSTTLETMALTYGRMDQILLPPQTQKSQKSPLRRTQSEIVPPAPVAPQNSTLISQSQPQGQKKIQARPIHAATTTSKAFGGAEKEVVGGIKDAGKGKFIEIQKGEKVDSDLGPWSREAFDLFDWWPPDRDNLSPIASR